MKRLIILLILFQFAFVYAEDPRDSGHDYLGTWVITETFQLNPFWIEDIFDPREADMMKGEIITYRKKEYVFQGKVYPIIQVNSEYYTSSSLREATTGSVIRGYGFEDLHLDGDVMEIRDVIFSTAGPDSLGRCLFVVDNNTILIDWRGWIFKAVKKS